MSNIFARLFKTKQKAPPSSPKQEVVEGSAQAFTPFSGDAYANDIYRGAVDAIARNAAKLRGTHIINTSIGRNNGNPNLDRLLQTRPNPYANAYDVLYRMVTHYFLYNNAFALLLRDGKGVLYGIYPLKASHVEFMTDPSGELFCRFLINNGVEYIFPYCDIIHLRRNYNDNELFGDPNTALIAALEVAHNMNEGIIKAIQTSAHIRGVLKNAQILSPEKLKEEKDRFMKDFMQMDNHGGILVTDAKFDYVPIESKPVIIDDGGEAMENYL